VICLEGEECIDGFINVHYTPGHTSDSLCFQIEDNLFTGDTLFKASIGRTDFYSGDYNVIKDSINKIFFYMSPNGWPYSISGEDVKGEACANLWSYILREKNNIVIKNMNILHNHYQTKCIYKIESVTAEYNYSDGTVKIN
jgi:hypothetical protein